MNRQYYNKIIKTKIIFLFGICLLLPFISKAATLSLGSSALSYKVGDVFIINIRLGVQKEENVNAIETHIQVPPSFLKIKDFSTGNSILTLINNPVIDSQKGTVSFSGIIPGGYSGRISGNPGPDLLLGKIIVQAKATGKPVIRFNAPKVLLNDGQGTPASLSTSVLVLNIQRKENKSKYSSKDQWKEDIKKDKIPPENFQPVIVKINGKYYLSLNTRDKESGIDYYLVREKSVPKPLPVASFLSWDCAAFPLLSCWHKARNLYLLRDQNLRSMIEVKAVDKAGNVRKIRIKPLHDFLPWFKNYYIWGIWSIIILLGIGYLLLK